MGSLNCFLQSNTYRVQGRNFLSGQHYLFIPNNHKTLSKGLEIVVKKNGSIAAIVGVFGFVSSAECIDPWLFKFKLCWGARSPGFTAVDFCASGALAERVNQSPWRWKKTVLQMGNTNELPFSSTCLYLLPSDSFSLLHNENRMIPQRVSRSSLTVQNDKLNKQLRLNFGSHSKR